MSNTVLPDNIQPDLELAVKNECSICKELFNKDETIIKPCTCSILYHSDCLERWIKNKPNNKEVDKCEVCNIKYNDTIRINYTNNNYKISKKANIIAVFLNLLTLGISIIFMISDKSKTSDKSFLIGMVNFYCQIPFFILIASCIDKRNYFPILKRLLSSAPLSIPLRDRTNIVVTFNNN
jgi:hypothetical protein